jgi:hypothetical protein
MRKLNGIEKLFLILPFLCLAWPLLVVLRTDSLEDTINRLSEPEAVDCGSSTVGHLSTSGHSVMHRKSL